MGRSLLAAAAFPGGVSRFDPAARLPERFYWLEVSTVFGVRARAGKEMKMIFEGAAELLIGGLRAALSGIRRKNWPYLSDRAARKAAGPKPRPTKRCRTN